MPFAFQWKRKKKKGLKMFCSAGPLLHQYSQARGSLGAHVVKKRNHVDDKDKDARKVKRYIRGSVCQVQSAWKLSVPWRADESPGPNVLCTQMWNWTSANKDLVSYLPIEEWSIPVLSLSTLEIFILKIIWKAYCYRQSCDSCVIKLWKNIGKNV